VDVCAYGAYLRFDSYSEIVVESSGRWDGFILRCLFLAQEDAEGTGDTFDAEHIIPTSAMLAYEERLRSLNCTC
jgi:hypothetical protein